MDEGNRIVIAVISALEEETAGIRTMLENTILEKWKGKTITRGTFSGTDVVLACSGAGKVNAALCVQLVIDRYEVETVLFAGIAGALNPSLHRGDIVVAKDCIQWDVDISAFGFSRGTISLPDSRGTLQVFKSDELLVKKALSWNSAGGKVVSGRILTGDSFITGKIIRERPWLDAAFKELKGDAVEMEGAAAAQVCYENGIPFLLFRVMSDTPFASSGGRVKHFRRLLSSSSEKISLLITFILKGQNDV